MVVCLHGGKHCTGAWRAAVFWTQLLHTSRSGAVYFVPAIKPVRLIDLHWSFFHGEYCLIACVTLTVTYNVKFKKENL